MKHILSLLILLTVLFSCKKNDFELEPSSGEINQLTVIIDDKLWNGEIGDSIRKKLASPVIGLPQEEPLFNLLQHTDTNGDDHFCKNRNILIIEKSTENFFEIRHDNFALEQNVIYLSGKTIPDIVETLETKYDTIIQTIKNFEFKESHKQFKLAPLDTEFLTQKFGINLSVPDTYKIAANHHDLVWLKRDIENASLNLLIYEAAFYDSKSLDDFIEYISETRDSIGKKYIHSQDKTDNDYMRTEKSYAPYISKTRLANKFTYITRGTWEIRSAFMSGPFMNYSFTDPKNNRNLILEGFIYAPSAAKRNHTHELEAIIKSIQIK